MKKSIKSRSPNDKVGEKVYHLWLGTKYNIFKPQPVILAVASLNNDYKRNFLSV